MIIRKNKSFSIAEVESKVITLTQILKAQSPSIGEKKIEELIYLMIKKGS